MTRRKWIFHPVLASAGFVLPVALVNVATAETPKDTSASATEAPAASQPTTGESVKVDPAAGEMQQKDATPSTAGDSSQATAPSDAGEPSESSDVSAAPPPSTGATEEYVVKEGDTLGAIAREHLGSVQAWRRIAELNGVDDPTKLSVGMRLELPAD
jgi:nucleoid-associated protein YgaU